MKIFNGIIAVIGVLVALAVWWGNHATDSANTLIAEGNAKLTLGNEHVKAAVVKLQAVEAASFPAQAVEIRQLANEGAELYDKSGKCFRESAAKFQVAAETIHDSVMKEYFGLEQKSIAKLAQLQELLQKYLLVYADPAITDADALLQKTKSYAEQVTAVSNEYDVLKAAAERFAAQHRDKINKAK